jgi:hypothetical protein
MSGCRNRQDLTFQYPCSLRLPRFARGTNQARFPLRAGGTLRRGFGLCPRCARGTEWGLGSVFAPLLEVPPASRGEPRRYQG